jgi:uncharacterized protein
VNAFPEKPNPNSIGADDEQTDLVTPSEAAGTEIAQLPIGGTEFVDSAGADPLFKASTVQQQRDPAWTGLDVIRLLVLAIVALFVGVGIVLLTAHFLIAPRSSIGALGRSPIIIVAGQGVAYILLIGYMYVLVTRERRQPNFFSAIHWNPPKHPELYLIFGFVLSIALELFASLLPMPKNLPIETFFGTPADAWALSIFGITLAPLMEELFFRGFLYPVLARGIGVFAAIVVTGLAFALLHGSQLSFSWGPVLVIFLVGVVLTAVRAYKNSVAAGLLIHIAYNATISLEMFARTDAFRHLEKLNQ